ncbi:MAG: hypothetical protein ACI8WB_004591 [Phenylobacterium sp.]|jgi:hypothetical protein
MTLVSKYVTLQRNHLLHHNCVIFVLKQLHMNYMRLFSVRKCLVLKQNLITLNSYLNILYNLTGCGRAKGETHHNCGAKIDGDDVLMVFLVACCWHVAVYLATIPTL